MWKKPITKATDCMIPFIEHFWNDSLLAKENRLVAARGYWWGKGGKKDGYVYKGVTGVSFIDRDRMKR